MESAAETRLHELHTGACGSLHRAYPLLGMARALHRNRRGQPLSFADKPFLIPLYAWLDTLHEASFCKAVLTGISELMIQKILHDAGWKNRICAYIMPQYATSERFVSERIDPLLLSVPAYAARVPGGEYGPGVKAQGNLKRKRFGHLGSLLFLGSNTPSDFLEFSADTVIVDEYDVCDWNNVGKVWDRVRESSYPQVFRVSNPDFAGKGIHEAWKKGSRSKWYHQCPRCGERQPLDWEEHFVRRLDDGRWAPRDTERASLPALCDLRPVCRRCHQPWDRTAKGACWVAESPFATASFHVSRLDVLATTDRPQEMRRFFLEWLAAQGSSQKLRHFYRGVLGWPREDAGSRVTMDLLERAEEGQEPLDYQGGDAYKNQSVIMGVDVGALLHVTLSVLEKADTSSGYRRRGRLVCTCGGKDDLYRLQEQYHVNVIVIDADPETRMCKEIRQHFIDLGTCEVWLCRFHMMAKVGREAFGLKIEWQEGLVMVDRTQLLDTTLDELATGERTLPSDAGTVLGFHDQMRAPVRVLDEEHQRYKWTEGNDPDHFRLADSYERVALEMHERSGGYFEV